jgi:hypothetical protein
MARMGSKTTSCDPVTLAAGDAALTSTTGVAGVAPDPVDAVVGAPLGGTGAGVPVDFGGMGTGINDPNPRPSLDGPGFD